MSSIIHKKTLKQFLKKFFIIFRLEYSNRSFSTLHNEVSIRAFTQQEQPKHRKRKTSLTISGNEPDKFMFQNLLR